MALRPGERLPFCPPGARPALPPLPGGRMIVWPVLFLEHWDIDRAMARTVITPPGGAPLLPDVPNWTWHEYGMRAGFWRLHRLFAELGVSPTVSLNSSVCTAYPAVVEACLAAGWELNAHAVDQVPMHQVDDEAATIQRCLDELEAFSGSRPRGWSGPGLTETSDTLDHLARAGIEYVGDWVLDDEPVRVQAGEGELVALPYTFELHDIVMMNLQHHPSAELLHRTRAAFEVLHEESRERPKVMALALHPYLSGQPHRVGAVRAALELVCSHEDVLVWDGSTILDWFTGGGAWAPTPS
jgi:peptidoglycan/xylan/chitin deacetylase (PgdA/CDA1 family)